MLLQKPYFSKLVAPFHIGKCWNPNWQNCLIALCRAHQSA